MAPPVNDNYASPTVLNPAGETLTGLTTKEATFETGSEVQLGYKDQSVWFTFTPGSTGWYRFKVPKSTLAINGSGSPGTISGYLRQSTVITDFTGTSPIDSDSLSTTSTYDFLYLHGFLTSGVTYTLKLFSNLGSGPDTADKFTVTYDLTVEAISPPANDDFANAEVISGDSGSTPGTTFDAYEEAGEPNLSFDDHDVSVWYEFTPTTSGVYKIWVANADLVYVGTQPPGGSWGQIGLVIFDSTVAPTLTDCTSANKLALSPWAFTDDSTPDDAAMFPNLVAGTTYWIKAYAGRDNNRAFNITASEFLLQWDLIPPPSNDDFASADTLTGESGAVAGVDFTGATPEAFEPPAFYWEAAPGNTAWFEWTCPTTGRYLFTFPNAAQSALVAVYTGASLGALTAIAKNVDGVAPYGTPGVGIQATAGTTYKIQVEGAAGDLVWEKLPDATGVDQASAIDISTGLVATVDNFGHTGALPADAETRIAAAGFDADYHTGRAKWYKVTAPAGLGLGLKLSSTDLGGYNESVLLVYDSVLAPVLDSLGNEAVYINDYDEALLNADGDPPPTITVPAGETYYIVLGGWYKDDYAA